jgi:PAS domain S-box-containing protein
LADHFEKSLPLLPADYVSSVTSELRFILPYLFFFALALHLVAFLAGRLSIELGHERILKDEILQEMTSGLIVVDTGGRIVFYNNQFKDLLRLSNEEILRKGNIEETLSESQYGILKKALLKNISLRGEIIISSKNKTTYLEFVTSNLKSGKGKPRGTIALLNDVTPNREMIEVSQRAKRWQSLSEMGTSIAHEIRNPLASIKGAAQELNLDNKLAAEDKKLLNIIIKESSRLNQIITEFLDFTRERPVALHECNINEVIDEVCTLLERKEFERKVKIEKEIKGKIKSKADAEQLKQVLLNLGINAFESGTNKVVFRMYQSYSQYDENGVAIEVEDFGKGIESKEADKIFDPFFTTKPKGVGMGLAIARKIIQLHKGKISFESFSAKGTKFTIWLPLNPSV